MSTLALSSCVPGEQESAVPVAPTEQSSEEQQASSDAPGVILEWEVLETELTESSLLTGDIEIRGTPSQKDIVATSVEIVEKLREDMQYVGADLYVRLQPLGDWQLNGTLCGSIKDTPFGLELDRVDEVETERFEDNLVEVTACIANWESVPDGTDYAIWLAYLDAYRETPLNFESGAEDISEQKADIERSAIISVSNDFDIPEERVIEGYERFDSFTRDYDTFEIEVG